MTSAGDLTAAARRRLVLAIVLVWSTSLTFVVSSLERAGREVGGAWLAVQIVLLATVFAWALPPLLLVGPGRLERGTSWAAHFVLPVVAIVLSAAQGLLLLLRA